MLVMPSSNTGIVCGWLAGRFPGQLGHLFSLNDHPKRPHHFMPYALDNGRYAATVHNRTWRERDFWKMLEWADNSGQEPLWLVVPDFVGSRDETLRLWDIWAPQLEGRYPLAMAVQDGMTPRDVPRGVLCFIGGTKPWKWANLEVFCDGCERVHVGKVNGYDLLWKCHRAGAESCDGTGWFRGDQNQLAGLILYLEETSVPGSDSTGETGSGVQPTDAQAVREQTKHDGFVEPSCRSTSCASRGR